MLVEATPMEPVNPLEHNPSFPPRQFNIRSFIRLTTQMQDVERNPDEYIDEVDAHTQDVGRQLLFSYKVNPQTVFFLGYSDALIDDDDLSSLTTTDRTWFMKIGYAWTP